MYAPASGDTVSPGRRSGAAAPSSIATTDRPGATRRARSTCAAAVSTRRASESAIASVRRAGGCVGSSGT